MKCHIPEISWHNRDPVLSIDIQPKKEGDTSEIYRLASGGTDSHVLIWYMCTRKECGTTDLDLAADLTRHQKAVNCVRWSPSGELLASGDDESVIFIWKQKGEKEIINILDSTSEQDKEVWLTLKILRGHMEDVYDLAWSPNSLFLISGSVDNTAMVWDVQKGKSTAILQDHKGFVQGVAWDPKNKLMATICTDRHFRVFDIVTKKVLCRNHRCILPAPKESPMHGKVVRLYHDDTLQTFFRRLSFSPDGNLIVVPSGVAEVEGMTKPLNTTYIYTRNNFKQPSITLPSPDQYTVAVRFCPVLFKLRSNKANKKPVIPLKYRMIFAVATKSSVYLYDTQQKAPFALISNIHYTRLTDMSWSQDGQLLIVSSTDGFCSMISFAHDELGEPYVPEKEEELAKPLPSSPDDKKQATNSQDKKEENKLMMMEAKPIAFRKAPRSVETEAKPKEVKQLPTPSIPTTSNAPASQEKKSDTQLKAAKPIEVRKGPRSILSYLTQSPKVVRKPEDEDKFKVAQPIEIRKRPREDDSPKPNAIKRKVVEDGVIVKEIPPVVITDTLVQPAKEIIIESEKIIRSDEKFESPEKKNLPVTPIAIRRHPRTPESIRPQEESTTPKASTSTAHKKGATPIAIRRQPRIMTPTPVSKTGENAVDTWATKPEIIQAATIASPLADMDRTEDICLVISDDEDEVVASPKKAEKPPIEITDSPKTPRRVEFKTISTPKSKKKLL